MIARRFARVFQVDPLHPGSAMQRQALVDCLTYDFGSRYDHLNLRLARAVKAIRPFIQLGFHPDMTNPSLSSPAGINFSDKLDAAGVKHFALHEFGWLVIHYLLTEADKAWFMAQVGADNWGIPVQERCAQAIHEWIDGGWVALDPILLPAA